jgi:hypothetical protein
MNKSITKLILTLVFIYSSSSIGASDPNEIIYKPKISQENPFFDNKIAVMNGITFDSVDGFWDKWHLVTVRYREDSKQMRFIYANNIAWDEIEKSRINGIVYPSEYKDGSSFAKVAMSLKKDELFMSSLIPENASRYQIMVKDSIKYKNTRGWGYALFSRDVKDPLYKNINKKEAEDATVACALCHEQAATRGYVFIGELNFSNNINRIKNINPTIKDKSHSILNFVDEDTESLKNIFPFIEDKKINISTLSINTNFSGFFHESIPTLIERGKILNMPIAIASKNKDSWIISYADQENKNCYIIKIFANSNKTNGDKKENILTSRKVCN